MYRLYFSLIARFPGPKLAALTRLCELYYEIVKGGQYIFKTGELHEKYGGDYTALNRVLTSLNSVKDLIVRINPWELHINDPDYYDQLYAGAGKRRDKYLYYTEQFGNPKSMIGTISHDLHRTRRAPPNRFFSKASVSRLEAVIQEKSTGSAIDCKSSKNPGNQLQRRWLLPASRTTWSPSTHSRKATSIYARVGTSTRISTMQWLASPRSRML